MSESGIEPVSLSWEAGAPEWATTTPLEQIIQVVKIMSHPKAAEKATNHVRFTTNLSFEMTQYATHTEERAVVDDTQTAVRFDVKFRNHRE